MLKFSYMIEVRRQAALEYEDSYKIQAQPWLGKRDHDREANIRLTALRNSTL